MEQKYKKYFVLFLIRNDNTPKIKDFKKVRVSFLIKLTKQLIEFENINLL